ncbi:hypothetical protein FNAPI_1138 [Fusarium napiforme]|uniref:RRM domain-containing protein n=1 Tax=Fusarium napiforme TaxID=42672 RepID=A0A8H5K6E0_9HYPO|nr:hypothetical protein FNAPI_1138 [Fusarium napiforme]
MGNSHWDKTGLCARLAGKYRLAWCASTQKPSTHCNHRSAPQQYTKHQHNETSNQALTGFANQLHQTFISAMANHRAMDEVSVASFVEDRLVFLSDIPPNAKKEDVASFLYGQGFNSTVLYWRFEQFQPVELEHQGYCIVEFPSRGQVHEAIKRLPDCTFNERYLKAAVPRLRHPNPKPSLHTEAKAIPTKTDAATSAERIRNTLQRLEYPDEYSCSDCWLKIDVENAVMGRIIERENDSGSLSSVVMGNSNRIRSQPVPSPDQPQNSNFSSAWIYVTTFESDERKIKRIRLSELPSYERNGWHEWFKGKVQTEEGTDRDKRQISMIDDVNNTDDPKEDTLKMFKAAIDISRRADAIYWKPGHILGSANREALISTSKAFVPPNMSDIDMPSATSRGHHHRYMRLAKLGAGWGDYDYFREWQLHGRRVDVDMVEERMWCPRIEDKVHFRVFEEGQDTPGKGDTIDSGSFPSTPDEPTNLPVPLRVRLQAAKAVRLVRGGRQGRRQGGA